jgi:hypothetical protein
MGDGGVRPKALMSLAVLGVTALFVVLANDRLDHENARGDDLFESYGLGVLAVGALLVQVLATKYNRQTWLRNALVPFTSAVAIVSLLIGIARFD